MPPRSSIPRTSIIGCSSTTCSLYLSRAFDEVRAAGELSSDEDSETLASTFLALMDGLQIQWLYNREATDIDRVLRAYI